MKNFKNELEKIYAYIDSDEIAKLALDLANIRGPAGHEEKVAEEVYLWMKSNGLNPQKQFVAGERFNVIGVLPGSGNGRNLAFNSHMDTAPIFEAEAQAGIENPLAFEAWSEDDRLYGLGLMNCRGPMACWLVMAKALKQSGIQLAGDIILHAVVGEIGLAPVDEYQGFRYLGKGIGTEYAVKFGPAADYAVVAETTDFGVAWAECGIVYVRITAKGVQMYSPRLKEYADYKEHPNAIIKMVKIIEEFEKWARVYEADHVRQYPGGTIKPKVNIGAIRGGFPPGPSETANCCSIFASIRLLPGEGPRKVIRELQEKFAATGIETDVRSYLYKKGYIAKNVEPLLQSIEESYQELCGSKPPDVSSEVTSMWRDLNIYNEYGIPAATFGPARYIDEKITSRDGGIKYLLKSDMLQTAKLYAMIALKVCS